MLRPHAPAGSSCSSGAAAPPWRRPARATRPRPRNAPRAEARRGVLLGGLLAAGGAALRPRRVDADEIGSLDRLEAQLEGRVTR
jgi:hypothetical protein